ncbi:hypothetical protein [Streptosporangium sp. NPDC002607]
MEGHGFHTFENTADLGALGAAGIERMHQGAAGLAEDLQRRATMRIDAEWSQVDDPRSQERQAWS